MRPLLIIAAVLILIGYGVVFHDVFESDSAKAPVSGAKDEQAGLSGERVHLICDSLAAAAGVLMMISVLLRRRRG